MATLGPVAALLMILLSMHMQAQGSQQKGGLELPSRTSNSGTPQNLVTRRMINSVFQRVMAHVVDCGGQGLKGRAANECVQDKLNADRVVTGSKDIKNIAKAIEKKNKSRRNQEEQARQIAKRRFARRHPDATARLQRQERRQETKSTTADDKANTARPSMHHYKPFVDQPEFAPRYDADQIHREISGRAERFLRRTGYPPRDALEKTHIDFDEVNPDGSAKTSPFPSNLAVAASMKSMKRAVKQEEQKLKRRHTRQKARLTYALDRQMAILAGQHIPGVALSSMDHRIINKQVQSVLREVNPIAQKAIQDVVNDRSMALPPPSGAMRKETVTANAIANLVSRKIVNATTEAIMMMRTAHRSIEKLDQGRDVLRRALRKAKQIKAEAREKAVEEVQHIESALNRSASVNSSSPQAAAAAAESSREKRKALKIRWEGLVAQTSLNAMQGSRNDSGTAVEVVGGRRGGGRGAASDAHSVPVTTADSTAMTTTMHDSADHTGQEYADLGVINV